jgi:cytosine/adenosine deaminase-related metal-dependent hydrolase
LQKSDHTTVGAPASNAREAQRRFWAARWVLPMSCPPVENAVLELNGNKIAQVWQRQNFDEVHAESQNLVDFGNAIIVPGFINAHTHLEYTALQGLEMKASLFEWIPQLMGRCKSWGLADFRDSALLGANAVLRSGTTCVVDSAYSGQAAVAVARSGLRGIVGLELFGLLENQFEKNWNNWRQKFDDLCDGESDDAQAISAARGSGRLKMTVAPHAPYTVAPALLQKAFAWAGDQDANLPVLTHLSESSQECNWLAGGDQEIDSFLTRIHGNQEALAETHQWRGKGRTPVQHFEHFGILNNRLIAAHCAHLTDDDIQLLRKSGTKVVHCPRSNSLLGNGRAALPEMMRAGLHVCFGTDSAASNFDLDILAEVRAAWLLHRSADRHFMPTAEDAIRKLTIDAAIAVGWQDEIGSFERGKAADVAIFDVTSQAPTWQNKPYELLLHGGTTLRELYVDGKKL